MPIFEYVCLDCEHGFEALVYGDAEMYVNFSKHNKPGTIPLAFGTEIKDGCPLDCGLCPDHQQHTCLGIIEVNSACNMECPLCFASARPGFSLTTEEVDAILDDGALVCSVVEAQDWANLMTDGVVPGRPYVVPMDSVLSVVRTGPDTHAG